MKPLLAKGWAVARLYPEPGLRPYGDTDLYLRSEEYDAAVTALRNPDTLRGPVDLHRGFPELDDRSRLPADTRPSTADTVTRGHGAGTRLTVIDDGNTTAYNTACRRFGRSRRHDSR